MEKKTHPKIDAVAMVRRIRDRQHEQLEGKSWEEKAAFFRERAAALNAVERKPEMPNAQELSP